MTTKKRQIFEPGQRVWFEVNGWDYEGEVIEDDGGRHVRIDVDGAGIIDIFHTIVAPDGRAITRKPEL